MGAVPTAGMTGEALARIRYDPGQLATTIEFAALRSGDPTAHDVMFTRLYPDRIETPASSPDATQVSYCTGEAAMYDELSVLVDPPVDAFFDIDLVLSWLDWLGDEDAPVTTTFVGDPATGITEKLVHEVGETEVVVPCVTDWTPDEVSLDLPDRFDDGRFLGADGEPVPTTVKTDAAQLDRLVAATDLARDDASYAVVVEDGQLRLDVADDDGVVATGPLPATVSGPDVRLTLGEEFRSVVSALVGTVELQTGPGDPLAILRHHENFTLRFVVFPE